MERVLCGNFSLICLDADDLTVLQKSKAAFLWESPPCASMDELISLAPLAAAEMAPERGSKIVSVVLYVNVPGDMSLKSLEEENVMTYVMSDIHGYYEKYRSMLEAIEFAEDDTLYVLGDVLDRGPDGFKILLDMAARPNVIGLLGNHELLAAVVLPSLLRTMRQGEEQPLSKAEQAHMQEWLQNGGKASILQFLQFGGEEMQTVCEYLPELSAYEEISVQGQRFVLVHAGLEHFSAARPLEEYDLEDFLFCRPDPEAAYFPNKILVFGHTPTRLLFKQIGKPELPDRIFHHNKMIGVDCGCAYPGGRLGCLCLDTMEEFYV